MESVSGCGALAESREMSRDWASVDPSGSNCPSVRATRHGQYGVSLRAQPVR
jgi:hypothetical protein